jgi:hypothetical protein
METILIIILSVILLLIFISISVYIISKMKGKIVIELNNSNYSPGETINGKLILNIKKPLEATELNIRLFGNMNQNSYGRGKGASSRSSTIFDFKQPVSKNKIYSPGEQYPFSIKIPKNILTNFSGITGHLINSAMLLSGRSLNIKWYLVSKLKVKGIDVKSKKVRINIV